MKILDAHNGKGKCLAPENKIDHQLLTALVISQAGEEWALHKFSGFELVQEATILFEIDLEWSEDGTAIVDAYFQNVPFDPLSSTLGNRETITFWVQIHDDQTLTVMWDSAGQINFLPYTPSFPNVECPSKEDYRNEGEMAKIILKNSFCVSWRSSLEESWTTPIIYMRRLIDSWDGLSAINWFSTGHFEDGSESKIVVTVSLPLMQEIKEHILSLDTISGQAIKVF